MATLNIRQLIDLAIGSPDPGHVNFFALHCLLHSFADKLNIIDEPVDCSKFGNELLILNNGKSTSEIYLHRRFKDMRDSVRHRMTGGADPDEGDGDAPAEPAEPAEAGPEEKEPPADEAPESAPAPEETAPEAPADEAPEETGEAAASVEAAEPAPEEKPSPPPSPPPVDTTAPETPPPATPKSPTKLSKHSIDRAGSQLGPTSLLEMRPSKIGKGGDLSVPTEVMLGLAIMKDQLDLAMEELHKLAYLTLRDRADPRKLQQLRSLSRKLRSIQRENTFIEGTHRFNLDEELSLSWDPSEALVEEGGEEMSEAEVELHSRSSPIEQPPFKAPADDQYALDMHLCYSPEKMLDQLMELKSEFCLLTNKVNELSASILEQDSQRTAMILQELQEQMREQVTFARTLKDQLDLYDLRQGSAVTSMDQVTRKLQELTYEKIDKTEVVVLLADKVDYTQLQRKVSKEQMQELQCRTEKQFCEVQKIISLSERNMMQAMEGLRQTLGLHVIEEVLSKFKEKIDRDIHAIHETLQKYLQDTNDDCAAAGARIKVLQDLACLSCDTTCVMRTMERAKVPKLPSAKATSLISPLITYELGSIRKSGIMGYYRKDEFPHAPHAWMDRNAASMKACVPRHAGGSHTTHTAKEHVEKVLMNKK